jgi:hypothetical protein
VIQRLEAGAALIRRLCGQHGGLKLDTASALSVIVRSRYSLGPASHLGYAAMAGTATLQ